MRQHRVELVEPLISEVDDRDSQRILDLIEQLDLDLIETKKTLPDPPLIGAGKRTLRNS